MVPRQTSARPVKVGVRQVLVVASSSRIVMSSVPMSFAPRVPFTVTVRGPLAVSFPTAVTVTSTEAVSFGRTTWWPPVPESASPGLTL